MRAAPAGGIRNPASGTLWVERKQVYAVCAKRNGYAASNDEGPQVDLLDEAWSNAGESLRDKGGRCAGEQEFPVPRNPEKAARDQARSVAMLQRMLRERLDQVQREQQPVQPPPPPASTRRR